MTTKFRWHQVPRATIVAEAFQLSLAIASLALGWMSFPLLYALLGVEVALVVIVSARIYGRSYAKAAIDAAKSVAMWVFCGVFVFAAYSGAGGFAQGLRIEPQGFAAMAALMAFRIGGAALEARGSSDPRLHWTRAVALRGGVLWLSMFFAAFACFIPGLPLAVALKTVLPDVAPDLALGFSLAAVQAFLGCVVATMTPAELADISRQPYLDS